MINDLIAKLITDGTADRIEHFLTAWIFTDDGHLLTAGHWFKTEHATIGQNFTITFLNGEVMQAELKEFRYDLQYGLDYGILKIVTPDRFKRFGLIPFANGHKFTTDEKFQLKGYCEEFRPKLVSTVPGTFLPPVGDGKGTMAHLGLDGTRHLEGMSGGVVLNPRTEKAIAVQAQQGKRAHRQDALATIIATIQSPIISRAKESAVLFKSGASAKDPSINILKNLDQVQRISLVVQDLNAESKELRKVAESHVSKSKQNAFADGVDLLSGRIGSYFRGGTLPPINWTLTRRSLEDIQDPRWPGISGLQRTYPDANREIRILTDLSGLYVDGHDPLFANVSIDNSHVIGISVAEGTEDSINISSDTRFDLVFRIVYKDVKYAVATIMNIVTDVSLDISIYYANYFETSGFQSVADRKRLSRLKANFVLSNRGQLQVYGCPVPDLKYVSFAFCARPRPDADHMEFDSKKYLAVWEEFYLEDLVAGTGGSQPSGPTPDVPKPTILSLSADENGQRVKNGPKPSPERELSADKAISADELLAVIKGQRKLGKQLSERSLKMSLNKIEKDRVYIFAVLVKKPQSRIQEQMIRATFGGKKYRLFMWAFLPAGIAMGLKKCIHLFKLYTVKVN